MKWKVINRGWEIEIQVWRWWFPFWLYWDHHLVFWKLKVKEEEVIFGSLSDAEAWVQELKRNHYYQEK